METLIDQLSALPGDTFITMAVKNWIDEGVCEERIVKELRSISKDNPPLMERALGTELFTQIMQP